MDVAIIGVVGAILAAFIGAWATIRAANRTRRLSEAKIELANFSIEQPFVSRPGQNVLLDFTVRNIGAQPALITKIAINCIRLMNFEYLEPPVGVPQAPLPPSMTVGVEIPLAPAPFTVTKRISQQIAPNDLDRFTVSCSVALPGGVNYTLHVLNCDLLGENGDRVVHTRNFIVGAGAWLRVATVGRIREELTVAYQRRLRVRWSSRAEEIAYVEKWISQLEGLESLLVLAPFEPREDGHVEVTQQDLRSRLNDLREFRDSLMP